MAAEINHKGRIVSITPDVTKVEIVSESACSACHAKGLCGISESKIKTVDIPTRGWDNYKVGDEVTVSLKASMGHKAVWIGYAFPLLVLLAVLMTLTLLGVGELVSGLAAIAAVGLWYLGVWIFRHRIEKEYIFIIK